LIIAIIAPDTNEIRWQCSACADHGVISGWRGSPWDRR
jgi:hypothetical protein